MVIGAELGGAFPLPRLATLRVDALFPVPMTLLTWPSYLAFCLAVHPDALDFASATVVACLLGARRGQREGLVEDDNRLVSGKAIPGGRRRRRSRESVAFAGEGEVEDGGGAARSADLGERAFVRPLAGRSTT